MFGGLFKKKLKSNNAINPIHSNLSPNEQMQQNLERMNQISQQRMDQINNIPDVDDFTKNMLSKNSIMLNNKGNRR